MTDEKEKTVEVNKAIERDKQPVPQPLEPEEELSELDVERIAGACGWTRQP